MRDISINQKLALIEQIRSQNVQNQGDMFQREQILGGKTTRETSSFKIRSFVAMILLCTLLALDLFSIPGTSKGVHYVFQAISYDYQDQIDAWIVSISEAN